MNEDLVGQTIELNGVPYYVDHVEAWSDQYVALRRVYDGGGLMASTITRPAAVVRRALEIDRLAA